MAQETTPQGRGWIYTGMVLVVLFVLFLWIRHEFRTTAQVNAATAGYHDIVSTESTNGQVVPVNDFQAYALQPGVVSKILVQVGQLVSKGQQLVQMDDSDSRSRLAGAEATYVADQSTLKNMKSGGTQEERLSQKSDMDAAQAAIANDQIQLATRQNLQAKGAASANEVEAARQKLQQDQTHLNELQVRHTNRYGSSDMSTQEAQLTNARQSIAAAQQAIDNVDIRAPFSGTVYSIPVSQYDFMQTGEALLNVADLNRLKVKAYFDEPEVGSLRVGQKVSIVWDAKPNRVWHGHIEQAPTTIKAYGTRHVGECIITVDDANGDLLPNTNVTVTVTTSELAHVLSIPREALHTEGVNDYVFKIVDNHLRKTGVHVGALNLTLVQIISGLSDGDVVALGSLNETELTDGLEVKAQQ